MADWMQYASEHKDWQFDFAGELLDEDTITSVDEVSAGAGLTIDQVDHTDNLVRFWLSGGVSGRYYSITATVETASGRTLTMAAVMYIQ